MPTAQDFKAAAVWFACVAAPSIAAALWVAR